MSKELISQIQELQKKGQGLPPIHQWQPKRVYDLDMRIDTEGRWFHEGSEIKRQSLVKLFSSVLKKEGEDYFLVTPVEKARITVEDVPFLLLEMEAQQDGLWFRTNVDDLVCLSAEHPLELRKSELGELPYIHIRDELWARFHRNLYYHAIEQAEEGAEGLFLRSAGKTFCIGRL